MTYRGKSLQAGTLALLVTFAVLAQVLFSSRHLWAGWPPSAFASSQDLIALVGGILVAAASAWLTYPEANRQHRECLLLSVRPPREHRRAALTLALALGAIASFTGSGLALYVNSWIAKVPIHYGADWALWGVWAAGTAAFIATCGVFGMVIAQVLKSFLSVLAAAVAIYIVVWSFQLSFDAPRWAGLAPYQGYGWLDETFSLGQAAIRTGFWLTVLAALIGFTTCREWLRNTGALLAIGSLSMAILDGGVPITPIPTAHGIVCQGSEPEVCTTRNNISALPMLTGAARDLLDQFPQTRKPFRVSTSESADKPYLGNGTLLIYAVGGNSVTSGLPERNSTLVNTTGLLTQSFCTNEHTEYESALTVQLALLHRLGITVAEAKNAWDPQGPLDPLDPTTRHKVLTSLDSLNAMSEQQFQLWLDEHWEQMTTCTLPFEELPHAR